MLHGLEARGVVLSGRRVDPIGRIDAELIGQLLVPLDQVIERRIRNLGPARPIRGLVIPNLLSKLSELGLRLRLTAHPRTLPDFNPAKRGQSPFFGATNLVFRGDAVTTPLR